MEEALTQMATAEEALTQLATEEEALRQLATADAAAAEAEPTRSAHSDPLCSGLPQTPLQAFHGAQSELGEYALTRVSYAGSAYFRGPRAIAHASAQVLGRSKFISNHYADYGL